MLAFLSLSGIFLSIILLYFHARKYGSSIYLALFFLFISLYGLYQYILLYSGSVTYITLFQVVLSLACSPPYLIGPMLYFYVRSVLTDSPKLRRKDLWHFLPMAVYFISALPNAFVPWQEKVEVAEAVVRSQEFLMVYKATLLGNFIPAVFLYLFRTLLVFVYAAWSAVLFIHYLRKKKMSGVFTGQLFMKKWLCCLLGFTLVLVISQTFLLIRSFEMHFSELFFTFNVIRVLSVAGLLGLLISPFFFPAILYGLPRLPETGIHHKNKKERPAPEPVKSAKTKNSFETEYLNIIHQKTDAVMTELQPYLESDFNLAKLSVMIEVPVHHLAYFFREVKNERFLDYRNRWRVFYAKKLIKEGKTSELTLEAIGLNAGFSNRNAFRNAFKKVEGSSPNDFLSK